ncbi:MAG: mechanosensitive ion channel family protein [Treponema sp.]|nr:mechanosensitive ion channel family protein [Treponema sp.]
MNNINNILAMLSGDIFSSALTLRLGVAAAFVIVQIILIWVVVIFFRWLQKKAAFLIKKYSPALTIKKIRILEAAQIPGAIYFFIRIVKWVVIATQLFLTIPLVLSLFEPTSNAAHALLGYILAPINKVFTGILRYIPNMITIIVFIAVSKYLIRSLKFFADRIEKEKLVVPGFYSDWAHPTFNILRFLIYAFTVAMVYPYLPGADSRIFQGVSVFVGIIISFGSGPAIGNLVAGLVLTYMRPFKLGDRIQIQNITGFVVEKSPVIIRLRTHKNEYVTFPNSMVLTSNIINYHTSTTEQGLILNAEISFCYALAWQTVHEILINAALKTNHILEEPKPFVLQTALEDFYARYQINAYTKTVDLVPSIYSELFENIQNGFKEAGLDMTAAHFRINLVDDKRNK